ncbi:anthranilate synthase component I [Salibacterium qingdaonense]|uniref:Anthranilate synthase component 1 n=1 Tax=Salibacterium qingdaonense TaxID=266892 RepID=A0A1I4M3K2_9BACI|nr:anthranilate synthase component I [Salibacterium qingdaonense]SFL97812.1 anthranilate synthase, component I [Salibacterium qingdaonense]
MSETSFSTFCKQAETYSMIPYVSTFFTDTLTPIEVFQKFQEEAVFLLESKDEASLWSRYSFIGLHPQFTITDRGGNYAFVNEKGALLKENTSLSVLFDEAIQYLAPAPAEVDIPFLGGAVGVIPYDSIEDFEPDLQKEEDAPGEDHVTLQFCETIIAMDHENRELTFIHYNKDTDITLSERYDHAAAGVKRLLDVLTAGARTTGHLQAPLGKSAEADFSKVYTCYPKEKFEQDVERIKEYINAGDIFQAVLSQRFERRVSVEAFDIYRALRMINPSPYLFYLKLGEKEVVGSSPERLIQVQDRRIEIHPIAGTRKRGRSVEEDEELTRELLQDEKERAEHYMLVDLARNDAGRVAEYGSVKTPVLMEVGKFSHVMHIISKVTGELKKEITPVEALQASFPAGTVSGAPKFRAMEILKSLEPHRRGIYSGAVCYLGYDGNIDSCISIRTMVVENGKAKIQAGAGIVADSVPEKEYEETQNKAAALLRAVEAAEAVFSEKGDTNHV